MSVWYEIVVKGTADALRGYVAACENALGRRETVLFGDDLGLEPSRFSQRLLDFLVAGSHHLIFAPSNLAGSILAALRSTGGEAGLNLERVEEVVQARLSFSAEAFSRTVAAKIKQELLRALPAGVDGANIEESETEDPDARGAELYTPEHEYVYRATGTFVGPLPGIVEMRRRAHGIPFVKVKPLELQTRPGAPSRVG